MKTRSTKLAATGVSNAGELLLDLGEIEHLARWADHLHCADLVAERQVGRPADDPERATGQFVGQGVHVLDDQLGRVPAHAGQRLVLDVGGTLHEPEVGLGTAFRLEQHGALPGHLRPAPRAGHVASQRPVIDDPVTEVALIGSHGGRKVRRGDGDGGDAAEHGKRIADSG